MKKLLTLLLAIMMTLWGVACSDEGSEGDDLPDSGGSGDDDDDPGPDPNIVCIPEEPDNLEECGDYPEGAGDMFDLEAVVPNIELAAYYDRDCDGVAEPTTLSFYRDIYCQRDKIKSLVLMAGAACALPEDQGFR